MSINSITGNTLLTSGSFPPVRAASTGSPLNPAAGGLIVVDGVQLVAGDRVLCKDEASAVTNGIYAAATGPWVRTSDAAGDLRDRLSLGSGYCVVPAHENGPAVRSIEGYHLISTFFANYSTQSWTAAERSIQAYLDVSYDQSHI